LVSIDEHSFSKKYRCAEDFERSSQLISKEPISPPRYDSFVDADMARNSLWLPIGDLIFEIYVSIGCNEPISNRLIGSIA
jgi:hypothetical protein